MRFIIEEDTRGPIGNRAWFVKDTKDGTILATCGVRKNAEKIINYMNASTVGFYLDSVHVDNDMQEFMLKRIEKEMNAEWKNLESQAQGLLDAGHKIEDLTIAGWPSGLRMVVPKRMLEL